MSKCGKLCFETKAEAKSYIKKANKRKVQEIKLTNAYWCEECQSFHTTSASKRKNRRSNRFLNGNWNNKNPTP